jgi:type I restriction enzyme S subunit
MKRYAKYKDSGVEWIGEIPEGWEMKKLKYLGKSIIGLTYRPDDIVEDNSKGILVLRSSNIQNNKLSLQDNIYVNVKVKPDLVVKKGDILICSRNGSKSLIGKNITIDDITEGCTFGAFMTIFRSKYWNFISKIFNSQIFYNQSGLFLTATINQLTQETLNNFIIPFPIDSIEQEQIVAYLDEKTSHIDNLLDISKRKIGLLKEQRTSIINQVVTKGLNPNAKMKDSGVEWIGEIPEGWGVLPLKYLVKENSNSLSNSTDPNYKLKYIEISDVNSDGTISKTTDYIFSDSPSRCRRILKKGDVAISTVRTYLKSIFLIENEVIDLICSTGFSVLSPIKNINSKHLFYMIRSEWFISSIISKSEGVSYPSIQSDKLMNTFVLNIPPIEQQQIVEYLDIKTKEIDNMVQLEQKKIVFLKEYRQSLISEVVTGKIKVSADE